MKYEYYSKEILKDKSIPDSTKVVANHLIHLAGWEEDNILPSNHKLSETLSIDRVAVRKSINLLKEAGILVVNEDNTFKIMINGCEFSKENLGNEFINNMMGNFAVAPSYLNYIDTITPSARIAAIMFFDFNFKIVNGAPTISKDKPSISAAATYYGVSKETFKKRIQKCLEAEIFEYKVVQNGKEEKKIIGLKSISWIKTWIREDKLSAKIVKLQEEAKAEQQLEDELLGKEEYVPTEEDIKIRDDLLSNITPAGKRDWDNRQLYNSRVDEQIIWLRKRQIV